MLRSLTVLLAVVVFCLSFLAQENKGKSLQLKPSCCGPEDRGGQCQGRSDKKHQQRKEDGIEQYEVESLVNGKSRDFNVDTKGNLLVVEESTTIDAIPAAAKASILKKVADGKLRTVETFTKPGQPLMYEAAYIDKKGKHHEVLVKADGTGTKE
jgi:hypothetical protein